MISNSSGLRTALAGDGIVVNEDEQGLYVLDRFARCACRVPAELVEAHGLPAIERKVREFLAQENGAEHRPTLNFVIHVLLESLPEQPARDAVITFARGLAGRGVFRLVLHFCRPPDSWANVLRFAKSVREAFDDDTRCVLTFVGPFEVFDEAELDTVLQQGIRLRQACGWWPGCPPAASTRPERHALRQLAEFGLRVPAVWYIHRENLHALDEGLEESLVLNCSSGFALPLACQSPYYDFQPGLPDMPDSQDYCELLVRMYREYVTFDDVLVPLTELADLAVSGGWHVPLDIPARMQLFLRPDGQVGLFRQIPARSRPWKTWEQAAALPPDEVFSELAGFQREEFRWNDNGFCGPCQWRFVCGGLEPDDDAPAAVDGARAALCASRQVFLEYFACQRQREYETIKQEMDEAAIR